MQSFEAKLNPNNLYPTMPGGSDNDYSLFRKFMEMQGGTGIRQLGDRMAQPPQMQQTRADFNGAGPLRPGYTPSNMNVQYRPGMSDQVASQMLGVGPGGISPADEASNQLKGRAIDATIQRNEDTDAIQRGKLGVSQQRADVYEFKANNPGAKLQVNKATGHLEAFDPITKSVKDLGAHQLSEMDLIKLNQDNKLSTVAAQGEQNRQLEGQRQTGRETLEEMNARHAKERADALANQPGTFRNRTITDANGNPAGTETTTTGKMIRMRGKPEAGFPQGRIYNITPDKVQQAVKDGLTQEQ